MNEVRSIRRTLAAAALSVVFAANLVAAPLAAVIGSDLLTYDSGIHSGTVLSHGVYWGASANDKRTENYISYTPNEWVKPIITVGSKVTSANTVSAAAKALESKGYRVAAGMNGDFYYTSNNVPMGLIVTDGILRTGDNYTNAIGFMEDGTAVIGKPNAYVSMSVSRHVVAEDGTEQDVSYTRNIYTVNKVRGNSGIYLYTNDFNSAETTGATAAGVDVTLVPAEGSGAQLRLGQTNVMTVESVSTSGGAAAVPAGKIVLSANTSAPEEDQNALNQLQPGDSVTIRVNSSGEQWNNAKYITSGYKSLVENGQVAGGLDKSGAPRTAIGIKPDGTVIFYTIDGRQSGYSVGASETLAAQRMQQLGCTTAICLDGGGSTTMTATLPSDTTAQRINQPSGGSERAVSTQLFLIASNTPSGVPDHYYIPPMENVLLAGASVQLNPTMVDTNYIPMGSGSGTWSSDFGSVSQSGLYTAGEGDGNATVTVTNGEIQGSVKIRSIANPNSITARIGDTVITSIHTSAGRSNTLTLSAVFDHMTLISQNKCFHMEVTGGVGTITPEGVFTATQDGQGSIVISAGTTKLTIPVTVQSLPFSDVALGTWYYDAVKYVYDNNLMKGTESGVFSPNLTTSRSTIVQIFYNREGQPNTGSFGAFSDVGLNQWYTPAISWASSAGVAGGVGDGKFNPNGSITREQMAVFFFNYAGFIGMDTGARGSLSGFTDAESVHGWANDAMSWAVSTGLLQGSNNALRPQATASRVEIAQVLKNFNAIVENQTSQPAQDENTEEGGETEDEM